MAWVQKKWWFPGTATPAADHYCHKVLAQTPGPSAIRRCLPGVWAQSHLYNLGDNPHPPLDEI